MFKCVFIHSFVPLILIKQAILINYSFVKSQSLQIPYPQFYSDKSLTMVALPEIQTQTSHLLHTHPSPLITVFVGGTSGIGTHTVLALASAHAKNSTQPLLVFIVGRNKDAATTIIAECRKLCPHGDFRFVQARDLSLLQDVDRVCQEIRGMLNEREKEKGEKAWIDLLVMTQGVLTLSRNGRFVLHLEPSLLISLLSSISIF